MGGKKKRGKENRREEVLDLYKQWLQESRQALLDVKVSSSDDSNDEWRREAERRWGPKVTMVAGEDHGGGNSTCCWKNFVHSRLSNPPPPSPDSLLQEFYAHDTWSLLVCCILMSRVSSWETKHGCISSFFKEYPTPSSLSDSDPAVVREIMHPLGLFENRMKALLSLNHKFLTMPDFKVDLTKENKIYGIGQFGVDSFNIFCKSNTKCKPSDKTLASYCNWHKRQSTEHRD
jgi:methyl-CpG-binding domain protein 4